MKDWKIRQEMYHRLHRVEDYTDDMNTFDIRVDYDSIIEDVKTYMALPTEESGWLYPAKSYIVAVCYAKWLSEDFDEDFYELLNDPDLLYGNDPYFVVYNKDPDTYEEVIKAMETTEGSLIADIKKYYLDEFMLNLES